MTRAPGARWRVLGPLPDRIAFERALGVERAAALWLGAYAVGVTAVLASLRASRTVT